MASEPVKHRRFDQSMSKRTRKPQTIVTQSSLDQEDLELVNTGKIPLSSMHEQDEKHGIQLLPLKELMNRNSGHKTVTDTENHRVGEISGEAKVTLMVEDNSSLAMVAKQGKGGTLGRFVKVLSHLIKVKRGGSKKKTVYKLGNA